MHRDSRAAHELTNPVGSVGTTTSTTGTSRWLVVVVALCGALAGGSIVEAIAALAARTSTPVSPGHLIAEPLVIAGAVCGGLLAAALTSKEQRTYHGKAPATTERIIQAEIMPTEPIMWQPMPQVIPSPQSPARTQAAPIRTPRRALRHHRLMSRRATQYHVIRSTVLRSSVER